jgi:hypothetical protein
LKPVFFKTDGFHYFLVIRHQFLCIFVSVHKITFSNMSTTD